MNEPTAVIRRPVLTGHQEIEGLWFPAERFNEAQRARLLIEQWQTGASAYRFADGDLLRFRQPLAVQCETQVGWPLIRQGQCLCSALLNPEEIRSLPAADIWLVRGSQVTALRLRDAESLAPGKWIDVSAYTLLDTYDCRSILAEPVLEPLAVQTDVREILGGALAPVSPQQQAVMQALLERQRPAPTSQAEPARPAVKGDWNNGAAARPIPGWLRVAMGIPFVLVVIWLATPAKPKPLPDMSRLAAASQSVDLGNLVIGTLAGGLLVTLLLMGLRKLLQRPAEGQGAAPVAPEQPAQTGLAPRATPARPKQVAWRRWLTRLTMNSRLSALYGKRQAAYMRRMLEMFENGDLEEALRHAIPLGGELSSGQQSFGTPQRRQDLTLNGQRGFSHSMLFGEGIEEHLRPIYRQTFERLDREGRIEEAVFVLAELLKVRQEALDYLEKHGRHQQAADLALAWDMPVGVIVRLLCLAENWQRAVQVARRDDAFAQAVLMLGDKWPDIANRLRLEWAEALTGKGLWLQAVDVIWSLPAERERAAQWLLNAEAAGGTLAIGALVKRAILLPETMVAYGPWVEQLRDDPTRFADRAALAKALLNNSEHGNALAWLTGATIHAILADQASGHGRLVQNQLQALVKMSKDKLLQADLPTQVLKPKSAVPLNRVNEALEWTAPAPGSRPIFDAVTCEDSRYLVALGEAGAAMIDAAGKTLFRFAVPAEKLVLGHSRHVALALARRDDVWRISKLDLVNRTATDLGVLMFDVFARSFNGTAWTLGRGHQLRVVDVDRGFEVLWQVSDLPSPVAELIDDPRNEYLLLFDVVKGSEIWHYTLPERRLASRDPTPKHVYKDSYLKFNASSDIAEYRLKNNEDEEPIVVIEQRGGKKGYRLPDFDGEFSDDLLRLHLFPHWLVVGYIVSDHDTRWHVIYRDTDLLCAVLQWPEFEVGVRCLGPDWLMFDHEGRLFHFNVDDGSQRSISLN